MIHPDKSMARADRRLNKHCQEPPAWRQEMLVSVFEAAGHPSLSQVILGPPLYAKAKRLASKGGVTTSDLVLAVIWSEIAEDEDVRAVIRGGEWFIPAARRIIKLANRTRKRP